MHALLTALVEVTESGDAFDRDMLLSPPLRHRDKVTERVRRGVLRRDADMPVKAQVDLVSTTMLFESIEWLARRNALLLAEPAAGREATPAEAAVS